ncbi:MAG: GntR family transcriptional regulator [Phycisphaerae bacterium]|nr:GntR family transcriptional regulator [Tepidisphaeraceae bacterium]
MQTTRKRKRIGLRTDGRSADRSLVEAAYQSLLERIADGRLPSGAMLSELALSQELGVSRTPVHDAMRQLAKDGLVVREGRQRARVAGFSPDDVFEIFEMRKILEGPAAELAAGRMDRRHCAPLRAAADALLATPLDAPGWTAGWADFDELFHRTIADACGNRRLAADIGRYRLLHKGINRMSTEPVSLQRAMAEHLAILDAIEARDGRLARERMVAHVGAWQEYFLRQVFRPGKAAGQGAAR